jgi:hypothetical protein
MTEQELDDLADKICECCICPVAGRMSPLYKYFADADWIDPGVKLIEIAPSPGEMVGGKEDGTEIFDPITIDLESLRSLFDTEEEGFEFQYNPGNEDEDPHIAVYTEQLLVRIFFNPQERDSEWVFNVNDGSWREKHRG